jgi:hypothetical protein
MALFSGRLCSWSCRRRSARHSNGSSAMRCGRVPFGSAPNRRVKESFVEKSRMSAGAALVLSLMAGTAAAQTYEWTGNQSNIWHWGPNWDPQAIPGLGSASGAIVYIGPGAGTVVMGSGDPLVLASIGAFRPLQIGSRLQTGSLSTLTNADYLHNGTVDGAWINGGTIRFEGNGTLWSGGQIVGGTVQNTGTMALAHGGPGRQGTSTLNNAVFTNSGPATVGGSLYLSNNAQLINQNTMTLLGSGRVRPRLNELGGGGLFKNEGTLTATGLGWLNSFISSRFENTGTLMVPGHVSIEGFQTVLNGTVELDNGGTVRVMKSGESGSAVPQLGCSVGGVGTFRLTGSAHTVSGPTVNSILNIAQSGNGFWIDGGVLTLNNYLTNNGLMTWSQGTVTGTAPLLNLGRLEWGVGGSVNSTLRTSLLTNGRIVVRGAPRVPDPGAIYIFEDGILDVSNGSLSPPPSETPGLIESFGTVLKSTSAQSNTEINLPVYQGENAKIRVEKGWLMVSGGGVSVGNTRTIIGPDPNAVLRVIWRLINIEGGSHLFEGEGEMRLETLGGIAVEAGEIINRLGVGNAGRLTIGGDGLLRTWDRGHFRNEGRVELMGTLYSSMNDGTIRITQGGTLRGDVVNGGGWSHAHPVIHIQGSAVLEGDGPGNSGWIENSTRGTVLFDGNSSLALKGSVLLNTFGTIRKINSGQGTIIESGDFGVLSNWSLVEVTGGSLSISQACDIEQITNLNGVNFLAGGRWAAHPGTTLLLNRPIGGILPPTEVRGNTTSLPWLAGATDLRGKAEVTGNSTMNGPVTVSGDDGSLTIESPAQMTVPGSVQNGDFEDPLSEIEEVIVISRTPQPRLITPVLHNHARLIPGGHQQPGPFNLTGNLVMYPTGRILVELGGLQPLLEHDQVAITGSAALDGALQLDLIDEFTPEPGQQFTVLTATGGISGTFSSIVPPAGSPAGLSFEAVYTPTSVIVQVASSTCYANCDGSTTPPVLNVDDFTCFINQYAAAQGLPHAQQVTHYANCDGSTIAPVLNVDDFTCFINAFAAGCP